MYKLQNVRYFKCKGEIVIVNCTSQQYNVVWQYLVCMYERRDNDVDSKE